MLALIWFLSYAGVVGAIEHILDDNVGVVNDVHHVNRHNTCWTEQGHQEGVSHVHGNHLVIK